jgi:DNA-binding response OmpR family regulator
MSLCNDVLDLKKMEYMQKNLVITHENIAQIVRDSVKSFSAAAESRNLTVRNDVPEGEVMVYCSLDAVDSILSNLISNAVKYCDSYFEIILSETRDKVMIRVNSDGTVIPEKESERIFEVFYQSKNIESKGAGIGLTYSRSLALLQNGALYLDTKVRDVNSFVLELPKTGVANEDESVSAFVEKELIPRDKPCIMVVEDNPSMREAIREAMTQEYDVLVAENGEDAMEKLTDNVVDLVISDIMMPVMDGCQLCDNIKSDIRYSHIPVILLTAAVGIESHIKSLKSGADLYLEKPFKMEVLKESVRNQFRNREIRNEQFIHQPLSHFNGTTVSKVEYDFMKRLRHIVMDNLSDNELGIGKLAGMMNVSGGTLSKKVKANTGLTVNEYIRICRLKKAAQLLADNKYRINEVAYLTGFSTPSYFTQSFRKEFGVLPSEFVKEKSRP